MKLKILLLFSFVCLYAKAAEENPKTVLAVTWNVAEIDPPTSLKNLVGQPSDKSEADIVIVGLQEMTMKADNSAVVKEKWTKAFDDIFKSTKHYDKVKSEALQGMFLNVHVKSKYKSSIKDEKVTIVKTGKNGKPGNKGAVILKFQLNKQWFCIVSSHLPAHDDKLQDRINDYKTIDGERVKFCDKKSDYIFWLGDLNFRLDEKLEDKKIREMVNQKKFDDLLKQDQLNVNRKDKKVFIDFNEDPIKFAPTFKLDQGKGVYSAQRRPAWTDRVLYKSDTGKKITTKSYTSLTSFKESDHFPVQAQFSI